jgi:hypothetical protein
MDLTTAMLADAAVVESGKFYIHGGGWDSISVESLPATHPTLALALILRIEYAEALQDIPFSVELLDEDNVPLGPRLEAMINVGHPPGSRPGAPTFMPLQWTLNMVTLPRAGGYRFRISTGENQLGSVPFRVIHRPSRQSE